MALRETLQQILTDYPKAKNDALEGHPLAGFIRRDAANAVMEALGEVGEGLIVQGSPGQGNWAAGLGFPYSTPPSQQAPLAAITLFICFTPSSRWYIYR